MNKASLHYAVAAMVLMLLLLTGCSGRSKKIPISTSSSKAREYYLKGRDLSEKLRANEAREYFEKAIAEDPEFAMAYQQLAFVQPTIQGLFDNLDRAAAVMEKASEGEKYWIMGSIAAVNADPMRQRRYFKKMVEVYPEDERALNLLGNHYFGQQEYDKAIELYEKAIAINPDFSQPYNQLGYSRRFTDDYEAAAEAFKKYIELIPDDPNPYDSYAELLLKMGNYDESIEYYSKALEVNSDFPPSYLGIATNLNLKGEHEAAREELQKLYDNTVNDGQRRAALFGKAVSYIDQGQMKMAMEQIERMSEIAEAGNDTPAKSNDMLIMGNILCEMGRYDEALEKYKEAEKLILGSELAAEVKENASRLLLYNTGRVAVRKGDLDLAREKSTEFTGKVIALNNAFQIWLAHELAGQIALAEEDYMKALEEFGKANLQNPYTYYRMGLAYQGMGDSVSARETFAKAAGFNSTNDINYAFIREKAREKLKELVSS